MFAPRMLALSVQSPPRGEEILLVDALWRLGARAVEKKGERYVALMPPRDDLSELVRDAELVVRANTSILEPLLWLQWCDPDEWAEEWSAALEPRRIGRRFVVAPRGRVPGPSTGELVIRLAPGVGFGTAEHATTRSCLELLERHLRPGDRVADVGSGSGILAVAAVLLGAERVLAMEMDPLACEGARANFVENEVNELVEMREVEVGPETLRGEAVFDGITANLQCAVLVPLVPALADVLTVDGWLVVSGVFASERPLVLVAAEAVGLRLTEEVVEEGWWSACLHRLTGPANVRAATAVRP